MKKLVILVLLLATSIFATSERLGSAYHTGTGKIHHDGDFIEFSLSFDASCFADRTTAWNYVTGNVSTFLNWLDEQELDGEILDYTIDPISIYGNGPYIPDPCSGTFNAQQWVKVSLTKAEGAIALHNVSIQNFYGELQQAIWPLNLSEENEYPSRVTTTVNSIEKGIFEDTADSLRIAAKAKAREKATTDFLAFLGEDYLGGWYLQTVDFREGSPNYYRTSVDAIPAPALGAGDAAPTEALLKLTPLSITITGVFHFVFEVDFRNINGGA
jgi:hypothetical protein